MKKHFDNSVIKYVIFGFLMIKFICTALYPHVNLPLEPFAYQLFWTPFIIVSVLDTVSKLAVVLTLCVCISAALFVAMSILLLVNRRGAGFAAVALMVFCTFDIVAMIPGVFFFAPLYTIINALFNLTIIILLVLLMRSKPGAPTIAPGIDPSKV